MPELIKKFYSTAVALLILVLAGSYYLFFEKGAEQKEQQQSRLFLALKKEQIVSVDLVYPDLTIVLSRHDEHWYLIKKDKRYKADSFTVDTVVDAIVDLKEGIQVSEVDDNLAQYGLIDPIAKVRFSADGNEHSIVIGGNSPVGSGVYVKQAGKSGVILSDSSLVWPFMDRKFNDLRDREIINLDENLITRVRFEAGGFSKSFDKKGGRWDGSNIADYIELNQLQIEGIVRSFSDLRVVGFESDEPKSLSDYGLDKPGAVLTITEGDRQITYSFGNRKEEADYYMKLGGRPSVYLVSSHNFDQLPHSINDLRIKQLFNIKEDEVASATIENNGRVIDLKKLNGSWSIKDSEGQVEQGKITGLISELINLEVKDFADDTPEDLGEYGLADSDIKITLNDNRALSLHLGNQKGDLVYARTADKDSVYLLDREMLERIPASADDIIEKSDAQNVKSLPEGL